MGNIVFGAPTIRQYHLHGLLAQSLMRRGHRVTVLAEDPVTQRFYDAQGLRTRLLPQQTATAELRGMPLEAAALRDCRLAGIANPGPGRLERVRARLARFVPGLLRYFCVETPDLVLIHDRRTGLHRLIQYIAKEFGADILHTAPGLLPGTMQWDEDGIDADSSRCRRNAKAYTRRPRDEMFLMAALAAVLGGVGATPTERSRVQVPGLRDRMRAMLSALRRGQLGPAYHAMTAWQRAHAQAEAAARDAEPLPESPFVAVMLQEGDEASMRVDAVDAPNHEQLVIATQAATFAVDSSIPTAIVPPRSGLSRDVEQAIRSRPGRFVVCSPDDAMLALTTALAVTTVHHPHSLAAILAGTPVLHTGSALFEHAEVATKTTTDRLRFDLAQAIERPNPPWRESYLTHTLVYDHVWCDAEEPDDNGLGGLVQHIEHRIAASAAESPEVHYRAGPVWPLLTTTEE